MALGAGPRKQSPRDGGDSSLTGSGGGSSGGGGGGGGGQQSVTVTGTRPPANQTFTGSYNDFQAYYSVTSGPGLTPATRTGGQRRAPAPTPSPTPTPSPPVVAPAPDSPTAADPVPTLEAPVDETPTVSVVAPRVPVGDSAGVAYQEAAFPFLLGATAEPVPRRKPARRPVRRSVPREKPRPRRPLRRPAPGPRIPIPVPAIETVEVLARRTLPGVLLTLVPYYLNVLGRVDRYGTTHTFDRMFPPIPGKKRERDPARRPDDLVGPRGPDANPAGDIPDALGEPIDTVYVEAPRPSPFPTTDPVRLSPFRDAGYIYPPEVRGFAPRPQPAKRPRPQSRYSFDPLGDAISEPYPLPLPRPFITPQPRPRPADRPRPTSPAPVGPGGGGIIAFPTPPATPTGALDPLPQPQPVPVEDPCAQQRRAKRKQRKPRTVCWKGTYIERASGTSKLKRVRVDCNTGAELAGEAKPRSKPRSKKAPSLIDILNPH